jgi:hypothetical protein
MSVVIILGPGNKECFKLADGSKVETNWILEQFTATKAPGLRDKPKLFIFQKCR